MPDGLTPEQRKRLADALQAAASRSMPSPRAAEEISRAISRFNRDQLSRFAEALGAANAAQVQRLTAAAFPKPKTLTLKQVEAISEIVDLASSLSRQRTQSLARTLAEATQSGVLEQSLNVFREAARANLADYTTRLRSLPAIDFELSAERARVWRELAEAARAELPDEEQETLSEAEYGLRAFVRDLPSTERLSLAAHLLALVIATADYAAALAHAEAFPAAVRLIETLLALLMLYLALGRAIDAVENAATPDG
jgi:hypothetical protein